MSQAQLDGDLGTTRHAYRLGFWSSILTAVAAAAALGIATNTAPSRSGPFCMIELLGSCITYPFTDVVEYVPIEYIWMYPALLMALFFLIMVICIHTITGAEKKVFSQVALSFAMISATVHTINYFIQFTVVEPSLLKGELESLILFSQYNSHGIFIALEDIGYLTMGIVFLFMAIALDKQSGLERAIRIILFISGILAIGSLILLALIYGSDLEYIYEVAAILIDWITLIVTGILLGIFFRRSGKAAAG